MEKLKISHSTYLNYVDKLQVHNLWNIEYPENLSHQNLSDFEEYLQKLTNQTHFFLKNSENTNIGWALTLERENEKWFTLCLSNRFL
ncbi:MAG: hypothetical protein WAT79_03320 [Saprospiraceae bacterium]